MSRSVIAVYSGTFDPLTLGHEDVVRRAAALFDTVVIAVARAVHKKTLFSLDQALRLAIEVETLARMYLQALPLGEPRLLDAAQMAAVQQQFSALLYAAS